MQVALRTCQARPRTRRLASARQNVRYMAAVAGELLALASLGVALASGLLLLTGLLG